MARIPRKEQKVFASSLTVSGNVAVFGSLAAGAPAYSADPAVIQSLSQFLGGFTAGVVGNNSPAIQDLNALMLVVTQQLAYILQEGVPEWDAATTYYVGDIVKKVGGSMLYRSLTNANVGNAVTDSNNWQACITSVPASAITAGSQVVAVDAANHKIIFGNQQADPDGCYDPATGVYTVPVTGFYNAAATLQIDNGTAAAGTVEFSMRLVVNGVVVRSKGESVPNPAGARWYPSAAWLAVPLSAGDLVEIDLFAQDGVNTGNVSVSNSDFGIHKTS